MAKAAAIMHARVDEFARPVTLEMGKKSKMELGGSDAFIVLEDADLDKTVKWAVWGKMNNTGQCCVAAKCFIVVEGLADRFLDQFQAALSVLKPGDPMDKATTLGPLSTEAALIKLLAQVKRAVAQGATLVMGGKRMWWQTALRFAVHSSARARTWPRRSASRLRAKSRPTSRRALI